MKHRTFQTLTGVALLAATAIAAGPGRGFFDSTKAQPRESLQENVAKATNRSKAEDPVFSRMQRMQFNIHDASAPEREKAAPARVLGDGTTIYGSLIYSSDWTGTASYGIYSFPASAYQKPVCVVPVESYDANGGGTYADGVYYWNSYVYTEEMGYTFSTFCKYDFATGQFSKMTQGMLDSSFDQSQITCDMAYDPTTGTIYALGYIAVNLDEDGMLVKYYPSLSTIDPDTGFVTPIARIPAMIALASNQSGELYAISKGQDSKLYRINKNSGDYSEVGSTGLNTNFVQSMAFDPITDRLYWAAVETNGRSGLYEVNTETGAASRICGFEANEEYAGLYIPEPETAPAAPAAVTDFKADFVRDSHDGTVSLKVPTLTYGGTKLSGDVTVTVTVDGEKKLESTYAPGANATLGVSLDEGIHNFTATASNSAGNGPRIGLSRYVGVDAPAAVGDLRLSKNTAGAAVLTWTAPTTGRNDGYVDPAAVTYDVTRMPDMHPVAINIKATTVTDPVNAPTDNYWYTVTPKCGTREGIAAATEPTVLGNGTTLPCKFDFATEEAYRLFTVIDANGDYEAQYKWGGWLYGPSFAGADGEGPCAVYGFSPENAADDWLITPSFLVEKGKKYRLTYTMWTRGQEEILEVTAGTMNDIESQQVITPAQGYSHKDRKVFTQDFTASATGNYYAGFHITSPKKRFYLYITDIMVDEIPDDAAPAAVSGLTVTAGAKGALEATVSFTTPSQTLGGSALKSLSRVDIFRGNSPEACHSFNAPATGTRLEWKDTEPALGFNTYRVVACSGDRAGAKAEETAFVGYDIPKAPAGVKVTVADGGQPVISWTAPAEGVNGGYIDSDALTYVIYRLGDEEQMLSRNAKGTSFTDEGLDGSRMQYYVGYEVVPVSIAGAGEYGLTEMIVFGDPYQGEMTESFADRSVSSNPWLMYRIKGNDNLWTVASQGTDPTCNPADLDGGLAVFQSTMGRPGDEGRLVSPKLNVSSLKSPVLSFYVFLNASDEALYGDELYQDRLIPEVILPDGTVQALGEAILVDNFEGRGWLKYSYDLSHLKDLDHFNLSFHGISDYGQDIHLDLIRITNRIDNDMRMYTFTGPAAVKAGKQGLYRVTVYNGGAEKAVGYKVALYRNGTKAAEMNGPATPGGEYRTLEFPVDFTTDDEGKTFSLQARIEWDEDEIPANNASETISVTVKAPALPEVGRLEAKVENGTDVRLGWDKPSALRVADSFEDYGAFITDNFGDYTMVDGDKGYTYGFSDIYFPGTGAAQAFMVFDPVSLGIVQHSSMFPDAFDPHTGNRVLACFQAVDGETGKSMVNDDWIISPEVFGGQTVRLYAKAGDVMQGIDKFEVLYSTGDLATTSFIPLSQVISTDQDWTLHEFTLPDNARYFAIHCVSDDAFVLYIDDLSYTSRLTESPLAHTGYRVYRDGTAIADLGTDSTGYLDTAVAEGPHRYRVTALYASSRESGPSNEVEVAIDDVAVESVGADATSVRVIDRVITVSCAEDAEVRVSDASGIMLYTADGRTSHEIQASAGVYMVSAGGKSFKVIVR